MKFHSPAQELETVRRGLPVADEGAVDVNVNVHPAAITDPNRLRWVNGVRQAHCGAPKAPSLRVLISLVLRTAHALRKIR
jgi:hypothetical protein